MPTNTITDRLTDDRVASGAVDFDAALVAGDHEELLRAAGLVVDCQLPISLAHADAVTELTGWPLMIETYADAAHAVRRWVCMMLEPGVRH